MRAAEKRTKMRRSSWIFFLSIGRTSESAAAKAWILENGCGGNFSSGNALYLQNCKDNKKLVLPVNHHDYLELLRFLEGKKECLFFSLQFSSKVCTFVYSGKKGVLRCIHYSIIHPKYSCVSWHENGLFLHFKTSPLHNSWKRWTRFARNML